LSTGCADGQLSTSMIDGRMVAGTKTRLDQRTIENIRRGRDKGVSRDGVWVWIWVGKIQYRVYIMRASLSIYAIQQPSLLHARSIEPTPRYWPIRRPL
jgi:hypothetical protein